MHTGILLVALVLGTGVSAQSSATPPQRPRTTILFMCPHGAAKSVSHPRTSSASRRSAV